MFKYLQLWYNMYLVNTDCVDYYIADDKQKTQIHIMLILIIDYMKISIFLKHVT